MAIEFEIDGAGFKVTATDWPTLADSDRVEHEIHKRLEDLAAANSAAFRAAYRQILEGKSGDHAIVGVVSNVWEEAAGPEDAPDHTAFQNLVDVKIIEPVPTWAS